MESFAPGKNFLKVTGILYIIFGALGVLGAFTGIFITEVVDAVGLGNVVDTDSWTVFYLVGLVGSGFQIFIGIMGIANCTNLVKAPLLKVLGGIDILYVIVNAFLGFVIFTGAIGGATAIVSLMIGCVLPILYIIGAHKNSQA